MNLPSIRETVVLFIIQENYGISGYRIRRLFIQSTGKELSFGTLVPMLRKFEYLGLAEKEIQGDAQEWHLTAAGIAEVDQEIALLDRMLPKKAEILTIGKARALDISPEPSCLPFKGE